MLEAQANLADFKEKTNSKQMMTVNAAAQVEDESLDFIYVDARHDSSVGRVRCGRGFGCVVAQASQRCYTLLISTAS